MNAQQLQTFEYAVKLSSSGFKTAAYYQFSNLVQELPWHPTILLWLAFTTPNLKEAAEALNRVNHSDPQCPDLTTAQLWLSHRIKAEIPPIYPPQRRNKIWKFQINEVWYEIELLSNWLRGLYSVWLNGDVMLQPHYIENVWPFDVVEFVLDIKGHQVLIRQSVRGFSYHYDVILDGRYLRNGRVAPVLQPLPTWTWFFLSAFFALFISIRGIIPDLLSGVGASLSYSVARNTSYSVSQRIFYCLGIYILYWVSLIALSLMILNILRG
jgi:hypothetical protein